METLKAVMRLEREAEKSLPESMRSNSSSHGTATWEFSVTYVMSFLFLVWDAIFRFV